MEQIEKKPYLKYIGESMLVFIITASLGFLVILFAPVVILITVPLIFITVRRGFLYGFIPILMLTILLWWALGSTAAFIFVAVFAPAVYIISYALQKKLRSFEAVVFSVGAFAIGIALVTAFFYFVKHADLITYAVNFADGFMRSYPGSAHQFLLLLNFEDIITGSKDLGAILRVPEGQAMADALTGIRAFLQSVLPAFYAEYALLSGFLSYLISRAFLKKKGVHVAPIPAFSKFRLPKGFFMGLVIIALIIAAASLLNIPNFQAVFDACYAAYVIVFTVCGLSFLDFFMQRRKMKKGARIALLIITGIVFSFILAWIGLFDSLFKLKERIDRPDEFDGE